jgi:hypothetical protein
MKRFHVHVGVADLDASVRFYSRLFRAEPTVLKPDYAKWMVDEPRLNFAISKTPGRPGVSHLGLQADSADELADIRQQFAAADPGVEDEPDAACCYARSDKHWATGPEGLRWEGFHSRGLLEDEIEIPEESPKQAGTTCCESSLALASDNPVSASKRCCG